MSPSLNVVTNFLRDELRESWRDFDLDDRDFDRECLDRFRREERLLLLEYDLRRRCDRDLERLKKNN